MMNSFLNNFNNNSRQSHSDREHIIKQSLFRSLSENIKQIQYEFKENKNDGNELADCSNLLCQTIEAIFLHCLKNSFLRQTINVLRDGNVAGGSSDNVIRRPNPNFWPPLLIFTHKQVIEYIQSDLKQVNTEVGYCRAWIRITLNDSVLSSHFANMRRNYRCLQSYYKKEAYIQDQELMELTEKLLQSLEICSVFNLPCNTSLLNEWSVLSLQMAGIWSPPLNSFNIVSGIDIVETLDSEEQPIPIAADIHNQPPSHILSSTPISTNFFNAMQQKILSIESVPSTPSSSSSAKSTISILAPTLQEEILQSNVNFQQLVHDVDEMRHEEVACGRADGESIENKSNRLEESFTTSITSSTNTQLKTPIDNHSFDTLLAKHSTKVIEKPDLTEIWDKFERSLAIVNNSSDTENDYNEDESWEETEQTFEKIDFNPDIGNPFNINDLKKMISCELAREPGLDSQGYICNSCPNPLGIKFSIAQVCAFDGHYYCDSCISLEPSIVPSKIIHNWDFRKYIISKKSALFIDLYQNQPFINLKVINPNIYKYIDVMADIEKLRIKINFIRLYLTTCTSSVLDGKLKDLLWTKLYLYEHIHLYSINDLELIMKGTLSPLLAKAIKYGEDHIMDCLLCSQKGFICELCNDANVIYPFNIERTYRCQICSAVYHLTCMNEYQGTCPKCERKRNRVDGTLDVNTDTGDFVMSE